MGSINEYRLQGVSEVIADILEGFGVLNFPHLSALIFSKADQLKDIGRAITLVSIGAMPAILGWVHVSLDISDELPILRRVGVSTILKILQPLSVYGDTVSKMIQIGDEEEPPSLRWPSNSRDLHLVQRVSTAKQRI